MTEKVIRGNMVIVVTEDGNVESSSNVDVKCEVAGGSTILWLVKDGTRVHEGDDLVRLDSSSIEDQVNSQKIAYAKAEAAKIEAEKTFSASKIAVQEFLEGSYVQQIQDAEGKITVAMENLRSSQNSMQHTDRMARKGYVTNLQREAQAFAVEQAKINLASAHTAKDVLEKFTKPKMMVDLESKRDTAEAKMRSEEAAFDLESARLKRLQTQLEKCTVIAPHSGMVVYANESGGRPGQQTVQIEEGAGVRERQSIIRLPDLAHMQVKCTVHESKVDQLRPGMRARIRIQDRDFQGEVASVANQPEPGNWFSGNVKKYATIVRIDGQDLNLRPGMTAVVEILVADLKNVLSVPVEAVVEKGNRMYCWAKTSGAPERRPVVVGQSSSTQVEIRDGLAEGDLVLLNPRAVVPEAREEIKADDSAEDVKKKFGDSKGIVTSQADAGRGGPDGGGRARRSRWSGRPAELQVLRSRQGRRRQGNQRRSPRANARILRPHRHQQRRHDRRQGICRHASPPPGPRSEAAADRRANRISPRFRLPALRLALVAQLPRFNLADPKPCPRDSCKLCDWGSRACCCTSCARAWRCSAF